MCMSQVDPLITLQTGQTGISASVVLDLYNFLILSTMSHCRSWSLIPIIDIAGSAYLKFSELDLNLDPTISKTPMRSRILHF